MSSLGMISSAGFFFSMYYKFVAGLLEKYGKVSRTILNLGLFSAASYTRF